MKGTVRLKENVKWQWKRECERMCEECEWGTQWMSKKERMGEWGYEGMMKRERERLCKSKTEGMMLRMGERVNEWEWESEHGRQREQEWENKSESERGKRPRMRARIGVRGPLAGPPKIHRNSAAISDTPTCAFLFLFRLSFPPLCLFLSSSLQLPSTPPEWWVWWAASTAKSPSNKLSITTRISEAKHLQSDLDLPSCSLTSLNLPFPNQPLVPMARKYIPSYP